MLPRETLSQRQSGASGKVDLGHQTQLRLLYECIPMAYLIERAGGMAHSGKIPILDVQPETLHGRCPIFLGSKEDVTELAELYKKHKLA